MASTKAWDPIEALNHEFYEVVMKGGVKHLKVNGFMRYERYSYKPFRLITYADILIPLDGDFDVCKLPLRLIDIAVKAKREMKFLDEEDGRKFLEKTFGPGANVLPYCNLSPGTPVGSYITGRSWKR